MCKAIVDYCQYQKIVLPALSTVEQIVRDMWSSERQRIMRSYKRYSTLLERKQILGLLEKGEQLYLIVGLQQEMKGYNTQELHGTVEQHAVLQTIFMLSKRLLPALKLPKNTIHYYAELVSYYKGSALASLKTEMVAIYLICYVFNRFLALNDHLLDAFKKGAITYYNGAQQNARTTASTEITRLQQARVNVSNMLIAIKQTTDKMYVQKTTLFKYVPESELETTAQLLLSNELDPSWHFWQYIDAQASSITLNLRKIFQTLELEIINHEPLKLAVELLKNRLSSKKSDNTVTLPTSVSSWLPDHVYPYLMIDGQCHLKRFEFWVYYQIAQHIKTNKLTLQYTTKYNRLEDDLLPKKTWQKEKNRLLKSLPYKAIKSKPQVLLDNVKAENHQLFKEVNAAIDDGSNPNVLITTVDGVSTWKLKPLDEENTPIDSFFEQLPKQGIVNVMQFIDQQIHFTDLFTSILPRGAKHEQSSDYILAAILGNALRIGNESLGTISDLNQFSLLSVETSCLRMETLNAALERLYNCTVALPIFTAWNINGFSHGSLDGMKIQSQLKHHKAQASPKYFNMGVGLSSYNLVLNHFSFAGKIIGANEYEGHFAFELCQFQHIASAILQILSTDKHGINSLNFLFFYLVDRLYAPRIPKPHHETLWGFKGGESFSDCLLKPKKKMNETLWVSEWNNTQHFIASTLVGEVRPSIAIRKMASRRYTSKTKLA